MRHFFAVSVLLATLFQLSACGGGGGGGSSVPPPTNNSLTFSLSTNTVNFSTTGVNVSPQNPSQVYVTGTVTGSAGSAAGTLYIVVDVPNPNIATASDFTITGNTGQALISPGSPSALGPGSFTEAITVKACLNDSTCATGQLQGSPQTVTVNYTIPGVASTASSLTYSIGNAPTSASFNSTFQVSGYPAQSWTATSSVPWLTLTPPSGGTAAAVSVSAALDQTQVNAFDGGTYTGTVTLTPSTGAPITIPVTLTVARTQVNYVAPYVAIAGTTGNVIIRGEHFSLITPTAVNFGTTPASSFTVVSDTEIHATYPALQTGPYTVHLVNSLGVDRTTAQLVVINPTAYTAAVLQFPVTTNTPLVTGLVYDAPRQALLVNTSYAGSGTVLRYGYSSGWSSLISVALPGYGAIAETVDGTAIIAAYLDPTSNHFTVAQLDPVVLTPLKTVADSQNSINTLTGSTIASSNNGHILINAQDLESADYWPMYDYSLLNGSLTNIAGPAEPAAANVAASLDGSALLAQAWNNLYDTATEEYDSNQDVLVSAPVQLPARTVELNRDGSRVIGYNSGSGQFTIYDAGLNLLATLPASTLETVFGPISGRVYTLDTNNTVRIFDLSQPTVAGMYPEILPALTPIQAPSIGAATITPDEGALFLTTNGGVVVVPLQ